MSQKDINKMTFKELKAELSNCSGNKPKETLIRNIMFAKYQAYLKKKQLREQAHASKSIPDMPDGIKAIIDDKTGVTFSENDFNLMPVVSSLNELDDDDVGYLRDKVNNTLMQRMDNNIEIRNIRSGGNEYVPPFSNSVGGSYAPFVSSGNGRKRGSGKRA